MTAKNMAWLCLTVGLWLPLTGWLGLFLAMVAIFAHEFAHIYGFHLRDIRCEGPYLRVLGAYIKPILPEKHFTHYADVCLAGPASGIPVALTFLLLGLYLSSTYLLLAAGLVAWINAINLIPLPPLDGGHVFRAIAYTGSDAGQTRVAAMCVVALGLPLAWLGGGWWIAGMLCAFLSVATAGVGRERVEAENPGELVLAAGESLHIYDDEPRTIALALGLYAGTLAALVMIACVAWELAPPGATFGLLLLN